MALEICIWPWNKPVYELCALPARILIASIMEEYNKDAWVTLIKRCEEVGVDAFEVNFSCPHGMPERKMGMAMGQDCEILKVIL